MKLIDLTGKRINNIVVLSRAKNRKGLVYWNCRCDCGKIKNIRSMLLLRNPTIKTCGCGQHKPIYKHRGRSERLYNTWCNIKQRCFNRNNKSFQYYGGRGITMSNEWRKDYAAFRDWAMENGYDENAQVGECTIDRIDVNGNYEPSNCRWVSMKEQNKNKRNSKQRTSAEKVK